MADWRQIRARIRRAKAGADAATRLEQLFDKTRDGMVAFELALLEESSGRIERATDWYKRAWQRFRRTEWKQKAEEALVRHGIPIPPVTEEQEAPEQAPVSPPIAAPVEIPAETSTEAEAAPEPVSAIPVTQAPEQVDTHEPAAKEETEPAPEAETVPSAEQQPVSEQQPVNVPAAESQDVSGTPGQRRRPRHRGGRGRGRSKRKTESPAKAAPEPEEARAVAPAPPRRQREPERHATPARRAARERLPAVHIYRHGEPALASEIKTLEAKLRQLLASPPQPLGELGELPANPGVYLVSDLDLTTMYYVESCGNLRSALDQLISGRRGRQGSVRARLAKYLGISDSQASRYLKQHCVARLIDLEESDSNALGHFARAVLRPELMEESD